MLESMFENAIDNALDYYRGSNNSYEDSVKKQLDSIKTAGVATTLAVSSLGGSIKKELQKNTDEIHGIRDDIRSAAIGMYNMGQDIRNDIQAMSVGVTSAIQKSTYSIVASQEMLAKTFQHGFNAVNNTLDFGFNLVGKKIDVLADNICSKIDQIQDILNNPRLTQSRELYWQALISYKKGFFEEALKDCKEAVEKNTTDFISWYLLGLIYIFGAGENGNVINLDKAEEAFANAAKYIKPDIAKSEETKLLASEIFYHLGYARLVKSNDFLVEDKIENSTTKLIEAESASATAYQLSKDNFLAGYEQAKELHFLGNNDESLILLEELIRAEKNFALKAINDKNFESLWSDIEKLINKLKKETCDFLLATLNDVIRVNTSMFEAEHDFIIEKIKHEKLKNEEKLINDFLTQKEDNVRNFNGKTNKIKGKYGDLEKKDYFSVLDLLSQSYADFEDFNNNVTSILTLTKNIVNSKISSEREREEKVRERRMEIKIEKARKRQEEIRRIQEEEQKKIDEEKRIEEEKKEKKERRRIKIRNTLIGLIIGAILGILGVVLYLHFSWCTDIDELTWVIIVLMFLGGFFLPSFVSTLTGWDGCFVRIIFFIIGVVLSFFIGAFLVFFLEDYPIASIGISILVGGIVGFCCSFF